MQLDINQKYSELKVIKDTVEKHLLQCKSAYRAAYLYTQTLTCKLTVDVRFRFSRGTVCKQARVWQQEFTE